MITVLTTRPYKDKTPVLTKRFTPLPGGYQKHDYDDAFRFDAIELPASNIRDLSETLSALETEATMCIVRAETTGATTNIRRKLATTDGSTPPLRDRPNGLPWVMLDFDKLPVASLNLQTNQARLDYLVSLLPEEFHGVTYHYQWSSSAGLDGWTTLSCHLWFWLDQSWRCRTLYERFFEGDFKNVPVDPAPFTSNQIHYTASPIFEDCVDPVAQRSGLVVGLFDEVTLRPYVKPVIPTPLLSHKRHYDLFGLSRFEALLTEIGWRVHRPILRAIAHYCAVVPADKFDEQYLFDAVRDAVSSSGASRDYLDDRYLRRVTRSAQARFGRAF
ncbi:hypothetical protein [Sphingobium yanoikuyae]|uniref:hypothetical protein n=1 Tax=Sphingobium yanoikuyae TaxID=13690 RepID=UPI00137716E5|nr:hypothetical protein [Sphingobium yanoikuyae]NBB42337.1 hypothetical protein [Sphingobium yanoikuyae]